MALVIPDNYYQAFVPIKHEGLGRPAAVTFGVRDVNGTIEPQQVADDVLLAMSAAFLEAFDNQVRVGPVSVYFDQGGARGSVDGEASFQGQFDSNTTVPPQVALIVRKNTGRVGRPGRGRMFLPWVLVDADVSETGVLTPGSVSGFQARCDTLLSSLGDASDGLLMHILHEEGVPGGTTPSLVTSLTVDSRTGTQRRRNRG